MEDYKVHSITFIPFSFDVVSGVLWSLPIEGITEEDNGLKAYSKVSSEISTEDINAVLNSLVKQNLIESFEVAESTQKQQNWNEFWESRLNIIHITDRFTIKPTSKEYIPSGDEIVITIDPKMSFGTGEHETTKLCVSAVENFVKQGDTVLDLGSGTGILAIAASKLGAERVYAVDNDEWCLENGRENVSLNNADQKIEVRLGEIDTLDVDDIDVIIANINKNVLLTLGEQTAQKIKKAGILIISGFYENNLDELTEYFSKFGFKPVERNTLNNWSSMVLQKV